MDDDRENMIERCRAHVQSLLDKKHGGIQETSYPSTSLNFLKNLPPNSLIKLNIIISGAGLGGLSTAIALRRRGHKVKVFEKAPALNEVGAGIQVPPNSSRLLSKLGVGSYLDGKTAEPEAIRVRRWKDGSVLSITALKSSFREKFGAPYFVVHRAGLQGALFECAKDLGVEIHLGSGVSRYDDESGKVVLENGGVHSADLIVAADGVHSSARPVVLGGVNQPAREAGFAAYRAVVDVDLMKQDSEVAWLLDSPGQNLWIGDGRHAMTYPIANGKSFNMVLSHPSDSDPSTWSQDQGNIIRDMRKQFENWDPTLVKVINMIQKTLKWPLLTGVPLSKWLSPTKRLLIIGDAAHAMVPYMSQGAATAVEDGAALAEILSLITSPSELPDALDIYERVRILRTGQMQEASLVNGKLWHFADGAEQQARDKAMKRAESELEGENPNQWNNSEAAAWAYGYNAEYEVRRAWNERASRASGRL
ncbi:FAD/NAD(P)-binding domain-containing protein [Periconia macrospinosa]|uniref:FAD/NAD(P)-binding domain-containing protein n=1 Tax=Periconia macrospinosa TaxID=97972 RepID=A0A2V1DWN4_9PLEO|nr:FAD/NAD(P)-binding domain-containing protein [Periconia macrospinosa]